MVHENKGGTMSDIQTPENLLYTTSHEWIKIENNTATIGITDFAQNELSDIVFVEYLVSEDDDIGKDDPFCTVEAVKTAEDINSPVKGKITAINDKLPDDPVLLNKDPYGEGWLIKIEFSDDSFKSDLIDAVKYKKLTEESSH